MEDGVLEGIDSEPGRILVVVHERTKASNENTKGISGDGRIVGEGSVPGSRGGNVVGGLPWEIH